MAAWGADWELGAAAAARVLPATAAERGMWCCLLAAGAGGGRLVDIGSPLVPRPPTHALTHSFAVAVAVAAG